MCDGFNAIIAYVVVQHREVAVAFHPFLYNYLFGFWFQQITAENFTVYNKDIRTNNYLESYHAVLLKLIKPHPKIWEFIGRCTIFYCLYNIYYDE